MSGNPSHSCQRQVNDLRDIMLTSGRKERERLTERARERVTEKDPLGDECLTLGFHRNAVVLIFIVLEVLKNLPINSVICPRFQRKARKKFQKQECST